jgi:hypothetical protein
MRRVHGIISACNTLQQDDMFIFPLRDANGLDLNAITPGLADAARELAADHAYVAAVAALGQRYLADGETLAHGDYFPGSWLRTDTSVRIIDPEFCFLGEPEFDCGSGRAPGAGVLCARGVRMVTAHANARRLDLARVAAYAGVEVVKAHRRGTLPLDLRHRSETHVAVTFPAALIETAGLAC